MRRRRRGRWSRFKDEERKREVSREEGEVVEPRARDALMRRGLSLLSFFL